MGVCVIGSETEDYATFVFNEALWTHFNQMVTAGVYQLVLTPTRNPWQQRATLTRLRSDDSIEAEANFAVFSNGRNNDRLCVVHSNHWQNYTGMMRIEFTTYHLN